MAAGVEFYVSSSGDRWVLENNASTGHPLIHHFPNAASGGQPSHIELESFLLRSRGSAEGEHLLRLISSLVPSDQ